MMVSDIKGYAIISFSPVLGERSNAEPSEPNAKIRLGNVPIFTVFNRKSGELIKMNVPNDGKSTEWSIERPN